MFRTFRKVFIIMMITVSLGAVAQIPGTYPFAFLRSYFAGPCAAGSTSYDAPGTYTFNIPEGCENLKIWMTGGGGAGSSYEKSGGAGYSGAFTLNVNGLSSLTVNVGQGGETGANKTASPGTGIPTPYDQYFRGGTSQPPFDYSGAGGAATSLFTGTTLIAVAGGGGGAGATNGPGPSYIPGAGGNAGYTSGANGETSSWSRGGYGGTWSSNYSQDTVASTHGGGAGGGGYRPGETGVSTGVNQRPGGGGGGSSWFEHARISGVSTSIGSRGGAPAQSGENGAVMIMWGSGSTDFTVHGVRTFSSSMLDLLAGGRITVATGAILTLDSAAEVLFHSLTLLGTAQVKGVPCTTTSCTPLKIKVTQDLNIAPGAKISADGQGYLGGTAGACGYTVGNTTTGGSCGNHSTGSGGSHGGYGGLSGGTPGEVYGSVYEPETPGAGAGNQTSYPTTAGGGVIKLTVGGTLTVDGAITANGLSIASNYAAAGAGGSIWVQAGTIKTSETDLAISANGGSATHTSGAGGGGGRVAIYYTSLDGFAINSTTVRAAGGGSGGSFFGGAGTVFVKKSSDPLGDLIVESTNASNYKKTKIGAFGSVGAVSSSLITTTSGISLLPGVTNSLVGKSLRPDITQTLTTPIQASTGTTLQIASASSRTAVGRFFYVTDYETQFRHVTVSGKAQLEAGLLKLTGDLQTAAATYFDAYEIEANNITLLNPNKMTSISIKASGDMTLGTGVEISTPDPSTTAVYNLKISAQNLTVNTGAKIRADGKGYIGGSTGYTYGNTTTGGATGTAGGSHGGYGGTNTGAPNALYGSIHEPITHGSGPSGSTSPGGGVIRIDVTGTLTLNGLISANGNDFAGPTGAGGSVWINADTISSAVTTLNITANGGTASGSSGTAGGGGRVALYYNSLSGFAINSSRVQAYGGNGHSTYHGGSGTVYSKQTLQTYGDLLMAGNVNSTYRNTSIGAFGVVAGTSGTALTMAAPHALSSWHVGVLTGSILKPDLRNSTTLPIVSNSLNTIQIATNMGPYTAANMYFHVAGFQSDFDNVTVSGNVKFDVGYLQVAGTLTTAATATLNAYEIEAQNIQLANTNTMQMAAITATELLTLANGARVSTFPATTTAVYSLKVNAKNLTLNTGSLIEVDGKGYIGGGTGYTYGNTTSGGATGTAGGSHGGYGGTNTGTPNEIYGSILEPETHGAGASGSTSPGGGVLRIAVAEKLTLNGRISANGQTFTGPTGAGGSIWISADEIASSVSTLGISANGGTASSGSGTAGGGGRVAVYYNTLNGFSFSNTRIQAAGGQGYSTWHGGAGTIYVKNGADTNGDLIVDSPYYSTFKNTKMGVFGPVSSVSGSTLSVIAANSLLPGTTTSLAGKILKPDITQPGTVTLSSNTKTSLVATTSLTGMTSAGKLFYVADYETVFKNVFVRSYARLNAGYVKAENQIVVESTALFNSYHLDSPSIEGGPLELTKISGPVIWNNVTAIAAGPVMQVDGSLTMNGASHLTAETLQVTGDLNLNNTSVITTRAATTTNTYALHISADNLTLASGTKIDVIGKGYLGGSTGYTYGNTTSGGATGSSGGSHAGYGGNDTPNQTYGSVHEPTTLGAGGGGSSWGAGGGAIKLDITSKLHLDGLITANGAAANNAAGAGGSVWIVADQIASTGSAVGISASGGSTTGTGNGGGGGRIAIYYNSLDGFALSSSRVQAYGGMAYTVHHGGAGTIFTKQNAEMYGDLLISTPLETYVSHDRDTRIGSFGQVSAVSSTVLTATAPFNPWMTNALVGKSLRSDIRNPATRTITANTTNTLTSASGMSASTAVGNYFYVTDYETEFRNVTVSGKARFGVGYLKLTGALQTGATTQFYAYEIEAASMQLANTNAMQVTSLKASGDITLSNSMKISTFSPSATAVYDLKIQARNLNLTYGASLDVNGKGYIGGSTGYTFGNTTTGGSAGTAGGSHGGYGGAGSGTPNELYGRIEEPDTLGSGASGNAGAIGGGAIRVIVAEKLTLDGVITANGVSAGGQAGAGGSVWISADEIASSSAYHGVMANGGDGSGSSGTAGGGGRIAIYYTTLSGFVLNTTKLQAFGGTGYSTYHGGAGTIYTKKSTDVAGDLIIHGNNYSRKGNTKIGVFGHIQSITSSTTLNVLASASLLPGTAFSLAGKTLKPDIDKAATVAVASNSKTSVTAGASVTGLTAVGKYFYISDYETDFKSITISGDSRVNAGLLKVSGALTLDASSQLNAYEINSDSLSMNSTTQLTLQYLTTVGATTMAGTSVVTTFPATANSLSPLSLKAGSLTVCTGCKIDVSERGYIAGRTYGNVAGAGPNGGGSHGGYGGGGFTIETYGRVVDPITAGAGGDVSSGGGVLRLDVAGHLELGGLIKADGGSSTGAGAGGSIWISADTVNATGAGVKISANGGQATAGHGGCGGGGRVAIYYGSMTGMTVEPSRVQANGGTGSGYIGGTGTIYSKQSSQTRGDLLLAGSNPAWYRPTRIGIFGVVNSVSGANLSTVTTAPLLPNTGTQLVGALVKPNIEQSVVVPLAANALNSLTGQSSFTGLTAAGKRFYVLDYETQFRNVTVTGNMTIEAGLLDLTGTLSVTSGAELNVYDVEAGAVDVTSATLNVANKTKTTQGVQTSGTGLARLVSLEVGGLLSLLGTSKITTYDATTTAVYALNITAADVSIATGASIDVTGKGYMASRTIGNVAASIGSSDGGSYGGYGGGTSPPEAYGNVSEPIYPGTGGSSGLGGGVVRLDVTGTLTLGGTIRADGTLTGGNGGGSGGSVWISAGTLAGSASSVVISAVGGNGASASRGGGGGGRIAIYYETLSGLVLDSVRVSAKGGTSTNYPGGAGTIFYKQNADTRGSLLIAGVASNFKSTRLGVFGQVNSVSGSVLNTNAGTFPLLPRTGESLAGKILKPDITQPSVVALASNTNNSLTAVGSLAALTANTKYFYVLDYDSAFKNITLSDSAKVITGYLNISDALSLLQDSQLEVYDVEAGSISLPGNAVLNVMQNVVVSAFNQSGASALSTAPFWMVDGTLSLSGAGSLRAQNINIVQDLTLAGSAKIIPFDSTTTSVYAIEIQAHNIDIGASAKIDADGQGYLTGRTWGNTTTGAAGTYAGGSHGGYGGLGGSGNPNEVFGDFMNPSAHGAGGASGNGGGVIKIRATGNFVLNGLITANGVAGANNGGGAGGSIWVEAGTLSTTGSALALSASGGTSSGRGAGGGGRIAVYYDTNTNFAMNTNRVRASGGASGNASYHGGAGSIYWQDRTAGEESMLFHGSGRASGFGRTKLTLSAPLVLKSLNIDGAAQVRQSHSIQNLTIDVLSIQNAGAMDVPTNSAADYGAWFQYSTLIGGPAPGEY